MSREDQRVAGPVQRSAVPPFAAAGEGSRSGYSERRCELKLDLVAVRRKFSVARASNSAEGSPGIERRCGLAAGTPLYRDFSAIRKRSRRQMTCVAAVGDTVPDDAVCAVEEEFQPLRPCNPTSYDLGFGLRRKGEGPAAQLDLPAAVGRLHTNDGGHLLLFLPATISGPNTAPLHHSPARIAGLGWFPPFRGELCGTQLSPPASKLRSSIRS